MHALVLAAMVPLLLLSPLCGITIVAHAHHEHGMHVHTAATDQAALHAAEQHVRRHNDRTLECPDRTLGSAAATDCQTRHHHHHDSSQAPGELAITIPDLEPMAGRGMVMLAPLKIAQGPYIQACRLWAPVDVTLEREAPGGTGTSTRPCHLSMLCAVERLVRTSGALLL